MSIFSDEYRIDVYAINLEAESEEGESARSVIELF